jgi:hypothetical protein
VEGTVSIGNWAIAPGSKFLQHDGVRIAEFELLRPYVGTLWLALNTKTGKTCLVEVGL